MSLVFPTRPTAHDFLICDEPDYDWQSGDTEPMPALDIAIVDCGEDDEFDWKDLDNGGQ